MYTRCLVCAGTFEANGELERLPLGDRFAFDPMRGRVWVVCRGCRRWSLAPIEDRWEALEELERLTRDKARLLSQTDNIALLRSGRLEIVRVGRAERTEEAWWRYGRELASRRENWNKLGVAGTVATGAVLLGGWATGGATLVGAWFAMGRGGETLRDGARWLRFGSSAWLGDRICDRCGHRIRSVPFTERAALGLLPAEQAGKVDLAVRCPRCKAHEDGGLRLRGEEADRTLRRVLAYHHFAGASERRVASATRLIEEAGSAQDLTRIVVKGGRRLGDLQRTGGIALEIAVNEASEQRLLELELTELESHWRREEELAAIVDGELTPLPMLEALRRKVVSAQ
jgi:hypothetical protein